MCGSEVQGYIRLQECRLSNEKDAEAHSAVMNHFSITTIIFISYNTN